MKRACLTFLYGMGGAAIACGIGMGIRSVCKKRKSAVEKSERLFPHCGKPVAKEQKFCTHCGGQL